MDYRYGSSGEKPDEDEETERGHKQSREIKGMSNPLVISAGVP
jgi:hypothetical protein